MSDQNPDYEWQDKLENLDYLEQIEESALDEFDELAGLPKVRNMPAPKRQGPRKQRPNHHRKKSDWEVRASLADKQERVKFTYDVQRDSNERAWLLDSLGNMMKIGWISDVLRPIKGGKEASVYLCAGTEATGREFVAAKIYRPRMFRNLRNDHMYREGRQLLNADGNQEFKRGTFRALAKKTTFGKQILHTSWLQHEYHTMQILQEAGVDLPVPFVSGENAILMEYIGGKTLPAPTLNTIDLEPEEAQRLYIRCMRNLELMLSQYRVHGDYSAYNILYWEGKIWVIDFPQAVDPADNRSSFMIFERDVKRICEYFAGQGIESEPENIAKNLWRKYKHRIRPEVDPAYLDAEDEDDLAYWERMNE